MGAASAGGGRPRFGGIFSPFFVFSPLKSQFGLALSKKNADAIASTFFFSEFGKSEPGLL